MATSLSRSGALLTGLAVDLRCGDMVLLEYGECTAYFRIVWFLNQGPRLGAEVAVHKPGHQPCPWGDELRSETALAHNTSDPP
jgi:hypothetical protein